MAQVVDTSLNYLVEIRSRGNAYSGSVKDFAISAVTEVAMRRLVCELITTLHNREELIQIICTVN